MSLALKVSTLLILGGAAAFAQSVVSCSSNDMRRHYCRVDTGRGVELIRQRSDARCIQGRTWGYDRRGIWVDRGCRADFALGRYGYSDRRRGPVFRGSPPWYGFSGLTLTCSSNDMRRNFCAADTRRGVILVRQRSDAACIQGRTWGYNRNGIWVDRGCRAEFALNAGSGRYRPGPWYPR